MQTTTGPVFKEIWQCGSMVNYFRPNCQPVGGLICPFKERDLHFDELIRKQWRKWLWPQFGDQSSRAKSCNQNTLGELDRLEIKVSVLGPFIFHGEHVFWSLHRHCRVQIRTPHAAFNDESNRNLRNHMALCSNSPSKILHLEVWTRKWIGAFPIHIDI